MECRSSGYLAAPSTNGSFAPSFRSFDLSGQVPESGRRNDHRRAAGISDVADFPDFSVKTGKRTGSGRHAATFAQFDPLKEWGKLARAMP